LHTFLSLQKESGEASLKSYSVQSGADTRRVCASEVVLLKARLLRAPFIWGNEGISSLTCFPIFHFYNWGA
jgi:hypothetical protein